MRVGQATVDEDGEGFADEDFAIDIPVRPRSGRASCVARGAAAQRLEARNVWRRVWRRSMLPCSTCMVPRLPAVPAVRVLPHLPS